MRYLLLWCAICCTFTTRAQTKALPHGMVYGIKPDTSYILPAARLSEFMDQKIRVSTTIRGKVIRVTKTKGGWFELEAGKGKAIAAHFANYDIRLPRQLKGKTVLVEGVAQKPLPAGSKPATNNTNKQLIFEVKGLMIEK